MKNIQFPPGGPSNINPQSDVVKTKGPKRTRIPNFNFRQALNELSKSLVYSKPPVISKYNDEFQVLEKRYENVPLHQKTKPKPFDENSFADVEAYKGDVFGNPYPPEYAEV